MDCEEESLNDFFSSVDLGAVLLESAIPFLKEG